MKKTYIVLAVAVVAGIAVSQIYRQRQEIAAQPQNLRDKGTAVLKALFPWA